MVFWNTGICRRKDASHVFCGKSERHWPGRAGGIWHNNLPRQGRRGSFRSRTSEGLRFGSTISSRDVQPLNMSSPSSDGLPGRTALRSDVQPEKAYDSSNETDEGIRASSNDVQQLKALFPTDFSLSENSTSFKDEQYAKANAPILSTLTKCTFSIDSHQAKAYLPISDNEGGNSISLSEQQR